VVQDGLKEAGARGMVEVEQLASMRYRGQTNSLDIPVGTSDFSAHSYAETVARFETRYEELFGSGAGFSQAGFEVVAVKTIGHGKLQPAATAMQGDVLSVVGTRNVVFDDPRVPVQTSIYRIDFPRPNEEALGPCIIEYPGQSVVVPPGSVARADNFGNLHVTLGGTQCQN
jgi:N-methylhydantoinase A